MKIAAVIPSRYFSTRFPGKPLAKIAGKSMIERVYRQTEQANCFPDIFVATDDVRIVDEVKRFGGNAVLTESNIGSGSERVWQVIEKSDHDAVVNIQGDEPLISDKLIASIHSALEHGDAGIVTAASKNYCFEDFVSESVVKVVFDDDHNALYFSRSPIPNQKRESFNCFYHHIGIYGYKRQELEFFIKSHRSDLEIKENLEQLRFIENKRKIKVLITDYHSRGVDVPSDILKIEAFLK